MAQSGSLSPANFDVFLSHSHKDARWVEDLAKRLNDEEGLRIWLDKWILIPGESWQQAMASGIVQAKSCVVCISENTPSGWFKREIERALNHQAKYSSFRVILLILPNGKSVNADDFLELNTWVDFRNADPDYAFHIANSASAGCPELHCLSDIRKSCTCFTSLVRRTASKRCRKLV